MREIKWARLDSEDGERTLPSHAFKARQVSMSLFRNPYEGNVSLCGKIYYGNEDGDIEDFIKIEDEGMHPEKYCKTCKKLSQ